MAALTAIADALGRWLRQVIQPLAQLRPTAVIERYNMLSDAQLHAALSSDPDFSYAAAVLIAARQLQDRLTPQPLLPVLDLSATTSWPGGSITAAAGTGEPIAALCLPDGRVWFGGGLALWDVATIAFDAPVQLHAVDITAPSPDARPDIIGLDYADDPDGPWSPLLTHDVGSITATQRIAVPATTAACWRVSVIASAGATPALFAIQLYGHNQ